MSTNKKITITQKKRKLDDINQETPKLNDNESSSGSSSSSEVENSSESDFDLDDIENTNVVKKQKMSKNDDGAEQFSSAMSAILGSHLKQYDRIDPIMARQKKALEKIEQDKLDEKARKLLSREKKKFLTKSRKSEIIPQDITEDNSVQKLLEQEKKLKKIAQKGVVRLFNVITTTQLKTERQVNEKLASSKIKSIIHKEKEQSKLISEVSKETFLDLVKAAGDEEEDLF
ncbi:uncharacterized protein HGUI_02156 [Hanseniaspora guilliermondii]|uniref:Ribosomal RNA-processing protein 15 n=1 Tax=Hanseniaspora guilliermondii TaxID=56406 RepID=A0A1L0B2B0_9ASCO|nr:uncharacterized protein HGUI_02156 [Hanseniaspora guilliermondii]